MPAPDLSTIGQIMLFTGNFVPAGWLLCDGRLIPTEGFEGLFAVIGTTYGYHLTDGLITGFRVPDLQGAAPVGAGQGPGLEQIELGCNYFFSSHGSSTKGSLGLKYCICWVGVFPTRE